MYKLEQKIELCILLPVDEGREIVWSCVVLQMPPQLTEKLSHGFLWTFNLLALGMESEPWQSTEQGGLLPLGIMISQLD